MSDHAMVKSDAPPAGDVTEIGLVARFQPFVITGHLAADVIVAGSVATRMTLLSLIRDGNLCDNACVMIDLYFAPTPNGWKVSVMLEECELAYRAHGVDIGKGDQFSDGFRNISPNGKIPAIVDHAPADSGEPVPVFESGAILLYLAEKTGLFAGATMRDRKAVHEWLFWQVGGLGPMMGQHGHFRLYAPEPIGYAIDRYQREVLRLFTVLDRRLAQSAFLAGDDYSIADMACFPWVQTYKAQKIDLASFENVSRWYEHLKQRPRLRRGMALGRGEIRRRPQDDAQANQVLFGN